MTLAISRAWRRLLGMTVTLARNFSPSEIVTACMAVRQTHRLQLRNDWQDTQYAMQQHSARATAALVVLGSRCSFNMGSYTAAVCLLLLKLDHPPPVHLHSCRP
jgi:hypothetical protein